MLTNVFARLSALVLSVVAVSASTPEKMAAPYNGFKVLRLPTSNETSIIQYEDMVEKLNLDVWTEGFMKWSHVDVAVPAEFVDEVVSTTNAIRTSLGISQEIITMHENLADSVRAEAAEMAAFEASRKDVSTLVDDTWFDNYHSYTDHVSWLAELQAQYPSNTRIVSAGTSIQGRNLTAIHLYGSSRGKPALIYQSTVHAREWISTMVNEYMAYKLLSTNEGRAVLEKYDIYMAPFANPDGFVYTQTDYRFWRKNRHEAPNGSTCLGVDINRNWPHSSWGQNGGASTSPCSETYKGESSGSEEETRAWVSWINSIPNVIGYMDWHSYRQLVLSPYGYTCSEVPPDVSEHLSIMSGFVDAARAVHNTDYISGPICNTIYQASATSVDWAYDNANIKYSFTVELRDTGSYGFALPASQIRPNSEEVWAGLLYMWDNFET